MLINTQNPVHQAAIAARTTPHQEQDRPGDRSFPVEYL